MFEELKKVIAVPIAFVLFLVAAQATAGLTWRGAPSQSVVASR